MRVLICTPQQPQTTGNWVTARRYARHLVHLGVDVRIVELSPQGEELNQAVSTFRPQLIHLLHAYRSGSLWQTCRSVHHVPMVVTLTGTDIHQGLSNPLHAPTIQRVLEGASAIISQNDLTIETLKQQMPQFVAKLHHVPPAVELGSATIDIRRRLGIDETEPLLLHPASIRPVKRNLELLYLLAEMAHHLRFQAVFCGPVLDQAYGESFQRALSQFPWAHYAGELPSEAMPSVIKAAQVVLNHSQSEGLSNALVEATALGVPILATDIQGNAAVVQPGLNGYCYDGTEAFRQRLTQLISSERALEGVRDSLGIAENLAKEATALYRLYQQHL